MTYTITIDDMQGSVGDLKELQKATSGNAESIIVLAAIQNTIITMATAERLEALVDATDRNTAAIYDTAKPQPLNDQFVEQIEKAITFLEFVADVKSQVFNGNPSVVTATSLANKLRTHLADHRRAQS